MKKLLLLFFSLLCLTGTAKAATAELSFDELYSGGGVLGLQFSDKVKNLAGQRITINGQNHVCHFLVANSILYIETGTRSPYTVVHTLTSTFDSVDSLSKLEKQYGSIFLRIHASFIVNPLFVQSIRRFELTLTDGTVLPIPDRKYAKVAKALQEWGK